MVIENHIARIGLIFNLPQDVEILGPLLHLENEFRAINTSLVAFLSEKFVKEVSELDQTVIFSEVDTVVLLGSLESQIQAIKDCENLVALVSGSESSAGAHLLVHKIFGSFSQIAKVVLQHGWECIGFHEHRQQIAQFQRNVMTHANIVCTWFRSGSESVSFANSDFQVISSGVCKRTFSQASWLKIPRALLEPGKPRVLLGDNSRSPRFVGTNEMDFWQRFVAEISDDERLHVRTKFHQRKVAGQRLEDTSTALADVAYVISPPSTLLIDAIPLGCIPVCFSTGDIPGNTSNMGPIRTVDSFGSFLEFLEVIDHQQYFDEVRGWLDSKISDRRGDVRVAQILIDIAQKTRK